MSTLPFYYVDNHARYVIPRLPEWFDQIGSFDRQHILNQMDGILEPFIRSIEIKGTTFPGLMASFGIKQVDLLHIEAFPLRTATRKDRDWCSRRHS